jgi:hypothetical protein
MRQQLQLEPSERQIEIHAIRENLQGLGGKPVDLTIDLLIERELVDKLRDVEASAESLQVLAQRLKTLQRLALCDDIEASPTCQKQRHASQNFEVPALATRRPSYTLGDGVEFAALEAEEREDLICLTDFTVSQNNRLCPIQSRSSHQFRSGFEAQLVDQIFRLLAGLRSLV